MVTEIDEEKNDVNSICPICGGPVKRGCIYGSDRNALRWLAGEPSLLKNIRAGAGGGEIIGESPLLSGSHIKGIRCETCKRIIIET